MTPEEAADLLHDCDLLAPAGDATTTRLNGVPILRVVKAARAYAEIAAAEDVAVHDSSGSVFADLHILPPAHLRGKLPDGAVFNMPDIPCVPNTPEANRLWKLGYSDGLEAAARWHDEVAKRSIENSTGRRPQPSVSELQAILDAPAVAQDGVTGEIEVDDGMIDAARQRYLGAIVSGSRVLERAGLCAVIAPLLAENARLKRAVEDADKGSVGALSYFKALTQATRAEADANRLAEALRLGLSAVNASYQQAQAEHHDHMTRAAKFEREVFGFRERAHAALAEHDKTTKRDETSSS